MFCPNCGKEISDQAKFCNYCGTQLQSVQPQPQVQPVQPVQQYTPQPVPQPTPVKVKKKGGFGRVMLFAVICAVAVLAAQYFMENEPSSQSGGSSFQQGFKAAVSMDQEVSDAMSSTWYGAVYENGYLRYGLAKLYAPKFTHLPDENGDWLLSADETCLIAVGKRTELGGVSFDKSDEKTMLASYTKDYKDATMVSYEKVHINSFPVIRYITQYTVEGTRMYQGEMIIFPTETANETLRISVFADAASGGDSAQIKTIFNSLEVSPEFKTTAAETGGMTGIQRIIVK